MAKPIMLELPARDARAELQARLERAPVEHAEALLSAYELLQAMHDRGAIDLLRGALGSSDRLVEMLAEAANSEEAIHGMRNLVLLAKTLGSIDPELLGGVLEAAPELMAQAEKVRQAPPPRLRDTLKILRGPNLGRGLVLADALLGAWTRKKPARN